MDNTKAIQYDNLLREYQKLENQLARVPKLSIEDQSKEIMVGVEYSKSNQNKVNFISQKMKETSSLMMSLY